VIRISTCPVTSLVLPNGPGDHGTNTPQRTLSFAFWLPPDATLRLVESLYADDPRPVKDRSRNPRAEAVWSAAQLAYGIAKSVACGAFALFSGGVSSTGSIGSGQVLPDRRG
jgi:hypothetical protein